MQQTLFHPLSVCQNVCDRFRECSQKSAIVGVTPILMNQLVSKLA